jgi:predicted CXXCH cytochrome family protein
MRTVLIALCGLALLVLFAGINDAYAQFGNRVADTPHNLREAAVSPMALTNWGEICVYCHTPHNNNTDIEAPLWNRSTPTGPYTMYDSPSLDMTIASSAQGVSLACLSCHDNTIALDQVINVPSAKLGTAASGVKIDNCASGCHVGNGAGGLNFQGTVIGTNLGNDHPISITYDPSKDPNFRPAANGKVGNLPLYGPNKNRVECASCHNPHDNSNRPFLRMSNDNSAMCLACHDI